MPQLNAKTILLERLCKRELAHFYTVVHPKKEFLRNWAREILKELTPSGHGHPDIVYISKEDEKSYSSDDGLLEELLNFNKYPPFELPWKWFFLEGPHLIPLNYGHKILKTLEEINTSGSIIFLHYSGTPLLKTIEGRALFLRLPIAPHEKASCYKKEDFKASLSFLSGKEGLHEALEEIKSKDSRNCLKFFLDDYLEKNHSGMSYCRLLKAIRHFQYSESYHNSFRERFALLLHSLT